MLHLGARADVEHVERRLRKRLADRRRPVEPELVRHRRPRARRVQRHEELPLVGQDHVARHGREAVDDAGDPNRDLAGRHAHGEHVALARACGQAGRHDHRHRFAVRGLARLEARVCGLVRQEEGDLVAVRFDAVEPGPVVVAGEDRLPAGGQVAERQRPVRALEVPVSGHGIGPRQRQRDHASAAGRLGNHTRELGLGRAVRLAERNPHEPAAGREDDRRDRHVAAVGGDRQLEPRGVLGQIRACDLDIGALEIGARDRGGGLGRHAEQSRLAGAGDGSRLADDRDDRVRAERLVLAERRGLERRDEPRLREVLLHPEVERHRVGRLRLEPVVECRAVDGGEESQPEARNEEGHGHRGAPGIPRQRERGEADRRRGATRRSLQQTQPGAEQPGEGDGADERHEARKQEEQRARACVRIRVHVTAGQREQHGAERPERGHVERGDPQPAERSAGRAQREEQHDDRGDDEQHRGREPAGRENRMAEDLPDGRTGPVGENGDGEDPESPADDDPCERCRSRFGSGQNPELVAPRTEPRQPLPDALDVAAHPGGGQDREREEQRGGLSTHEEQAPAGDLPGFPRGGELVDRRGEIQEERFRAKRRACRGPPRRRIRRSPMDARRRRRAASSRRRCGRSLRARGAWRTRRSPRPRGTAARRRRRNRRGAVAFSPGRRPNGSGETSVPSPTFTKRRPSTLGTRPAPPSWTTSQRLGRARLRQPPRREPHEAPEVVGGREVRELPADPQELQLDRAHRGAGREAGERAVDERLEIVTRHAVSGDAEVGVDHRDRALVRRHALERAGERLVLRHQASADDRGQRRGGGSDPQREQSRAAGAVDEPVPGEPQRVADSPRRVHEYTLTEAESHDH